MYSITSNVLVDCVINTLRPRRNRRHFADDIFKCILLNENTSISIAISLKFITKALINEIPAMVHIMAWCRPGNKPPSEPMMITLPRRICVNPPQWVQLIHCFYTAALHHFFLLLILKNNRDYIQAIKPWYIKFTDIRCTDTLYSRVFVTGLTSIIIVRI